MYQERQLVELEEMVKPFNQNLNATINFCSLNSSVPYGKIYMLHYISHPSCSDFFSFLLMTATAITTITMRINTTTAIIIAAIVPPLKGP